MKRKELSKSPEDKSPEENIRKYIPEDTGCQVDSQIRCSCRNIKYVLIGFYIKYNSAIFMKAKEKDLRRTIKKRTKTSGEKLGINMVRNIESFKNGKR